MTELSQLFLLLSEPVRLQLLGLLSSQERCVCELFPALGIPQSTASRHLAQLRNAGIVVAQRRGVWMHYRLAPELWKESWKSLLPPVIEAARKEVESIGCVECCSPNVTRSGE